MERKLNFFRTPVGFDDAYAAAPSQKSARAAWGSDGDLLARGSAEVVTDKALSCAIGALRADVAFMGGLLPATRIDLPR